MRNRVEGGKENHFFFLIPVQNWFVNIAFSRLKRLHIFWNFWFLKMFTSRRMYCQGLISCLLILCAWPKVELSHGVSILFLFCLFWAVSLSVSIMLIGRRRQSSAYCWHSCGGWAQPGSSAPPSHSLTFPGWDWGENRGKSARTQGLW